MNCSFDFISFVSYMPEALRTPFFLCPPPADGLVSGSMSSDRAIHNLALIGFMGVGKSSVGRLVAGQLHFDFVDTDELIERRAGKSISDIFAQQGEDAFREMERGLVKEMETWRRTVIATGGGMPASEENLESLKKHALVVCLWASPEAIWQRVRHQWHRPLLQDPDPLNKVRALLAARAPFYKQADVLVNSEMRSVREVAQQVLHQLHLARQRPRPDEREH
jgi:shikimate kinase